MKRIILPINKIGSGLHKSSENLEHHGLVAYAACETFHLSGPLYFVVIYLTVTGILVTYYRYKERKV